MQNPKSRKSVNVRAEVLEAQFVQLLESLRPRPEFMALFHAIVLDVWRARCESAIPSATRVGSAIDRTTAAWSVLDNAFLFERRIDDATYETKSGSRSLSRDLPLRMRASRKSTLKGF